MMTWPDLENEIFNLKAWESKGKRAPHKHYLILLLLGKFLRDGSSEVSYEEVEKPLLDLLEGFGPPRKSQHPEYPFYYLNSNSELWNISGSVEIKSTPTESQLKKGAYKGSFTGEVEELLKREKSKIPELAGKIANEIFDEESIETKVALLESVNIGPIPSLVYEQAARNPEFRKEVLIAYNGKCAVCGLDAKLEFQPVGLDAAHIRWHKANGPNSIQNGLSLCPTHHRLFDRGIFTIEPNAYSFQVSDKVSGDHLDQWLYNFMGDPIQFLPGESSKWPNADHLNWHFEEVFQKPRKYGGGDKGMNWAAEDQDNPYGKRSSK